MKTVRGYKNLFEYNDRYQQRKKRYLLNTHDKNFERDCKETFKCILASDIVRLLVKVAPFPRITDVPDYIYDLIEKSKYRTAVQPIKCIVEYCKNQAVWDDYCSCVRVFPDGLKNNGNRKFGDYLDTIVFDARNELLQFRQYNSKKVNDYRFALLFIRLVLRTFYFSALPITLTAHTYNKCVTIDAKFASFYDFDWSNNRYVRRKFEKRGARYFNEDIAWWLVYINMVHYRLI